MIGESVQILPKLLFSLPLGGGLVGLLWKRRNWSTVGFTVLITGSLLLYYQIASYYSLLTCCISLALLPTFLGVVWLLNHVTPWFRESFFPEKTSKRNYIQEFSRKAFHLLVLLFFIPIGYFSWFFFGLESLTSLLGLNIIIERTFTNLLLFAIGASVIPSLVIENLRLRDKLAIDPYLLRAKEEQGVGTYIYLLSSVLLLTLFFIVFRSFSPHLLIAGIFTAVIYDFFSAIIGKAVGKMFVRNDRSLEGTVGGGLVTFLLILYFFPFYQAIPVVVFLCLLDLLHPPLDDNLFLPSLTLLFLILLP